MSEGEVIQVVLPPGLREPFEAWLRSRGLNLVHLPLGDDDAMRTYIIGFAVAGTREESGDTPEPCRGFRWIGQSFASCDECGKPAWEHEGEMRLRDGAGPFGGKDDWELRPWKHGEAEA